MSKNELEKKLESEYYKEAAELTERIDAFFEKHSHTCAGFLVKVEDVTKPLGAIYKLYTISEHKTRIIFPLYSSGIKNAIYENHV